MNIPSTASGAFLAPISIPIRFARRISSAFAILVMSLASFIARGAPTPDRDAIQGLVDVQYPSLFTLYTNLHAHPELSFMENKTAALIASELRQLGCETTEKIGNTGVVGILRNGTGPTVLVRADMDGLPILETTGLPYASKDIVTDMTGKQVPAMHGCAHDTHVTGLIGTARILAATRDRWSGTILFVAQPAEEIGAGARAMLADGLYTRFPKPDFALALHTTSMLEAGVIGHVDGACYASVNSMDIVVRGLGGHGSAPHTAKDPIVIAAQIVTALQTIVSRELKPGTPAVVTVGTIHGGLKRNIIPDEVKLELTLRAFEPQIMEHLSESIRRICTGIATAAGVPPDRLPQITLTPESIPVTRNDSALNRRLATRFLDWFGPDRVRTQEPIMGGEDFSEFNRQGVKPCIWWVGATAPALFAESRRTGIPVPSNHSSKFGPVPEATLKACVNSMCAAVLELLGNQATTRP
jgi:amidohydrolase